MTNDTLFRIIFGVLFVVVILVRRVFERRSAAVAEAGLAQDLDAGSLILVESLLLTLGNLGAIAYIINPDWMTWSIWIIPIWARWLGVLLGIIGAIALIWTHRTLGENFFGGMKLKQDHQLITSGLYQWVRHPMYSAFIVLSLSWFMMIGDWFIGGLWLVATALVIITRMNGEKRMMAQEFGEVYQQYKERTGRLFPRF